jgi:hypothetical protein
MVVCQSALALFHLQISLGVIQNFQTFSIGELIVASTVMFIFFFVVHGDGLF